MNFLLKIVEGPNKGAEIALVAGVAVTVGKGDGCDVVLADPTLPEKPIEIEASVDGVTVDGEPLNPFVVRTSGATSFAVGPVDTPWDELKWANAESEKVESPEPEAAKLEAEKAQAPEGKQIAGRRHGGCFGCLFALLLLVLAVAAAFLFFGGRIKETDWWRRVWRFNGSAAPESVAEPEVFLGDIAAKYGLSLAESNGAVRISGDLKTRAERLRATAEIYAVRPGAELDIADDESFRASADDALFTLTEDALKVSVATNRFLRVAGSSLSALSLKRTLEALNADLPKLRGVDVSGVIVGAAAGVDDGQTGEDGRPASRPRRSAAGGKSPQFPVCGILTTPYPCLVLRDGRRIMEGAALGDGVIVEIGADSVVLTNSAGRFTWRP